jgi:hypothetical protein
MLRRPDAALDRDAAAGRVSLAKHDPSAVGPEDKSGIV